MRDGHAKGFVGLGGNLAAAMPDPDTTFAAFRKLDLNVQICTKLNRTCLLVAKESIVLPCSAARSETCRRADRSR